MSNWYESFRNYARVQQVWEKGRRDPLWNLCRKDDYGNLIYRHAYGDRSHPFGWEIDHIWPQSQGGSDMLWNLRPLHYKANLWRVFPQGHLQWRPQGSWGFDSP